MKNLSHEKPDDYQLLLTIIFINRKKKQDAVKVYLNRLKAVL